jgi:hypothetical protein
MVSRSALATGASILLAIAVWYGLGTFTDAPDWVLWAALIGVGVLLPRVLQERL